MKIQERIVGGIINGVNRHWSYTKNLLKVKPEYLLTISVADELTKGFDNVCGIDLEIKLENPTYRICGDLLISAIGFYDYFKSAKHKVDRKGKVDIYVTHKLVGCFENESWIIELKGFDPASQEIKKELTRLVQFLETNEGKNKCRGCFLAFPTLSNKKVWLEKQLDAVPQQFQTSILSEKIETGESPEDGIPVYYSNCIEITVSS